MQTTQRAETSEFNDLSVNIYAAFSILYFTCDNVVEGANEDSTIK